MVTVDGPRSSWNSSGHIQIGEDTGSATLSITHGGQVTSTNDSYSTEIGSVGKVSVDGTGSTWNNNGNLSVRGALSITKGGSVTAANVFASSTSLLSLDIGYGSRLTVDSGNGMISNDGLIRFSAGASASAGTYKPILAALWTGSGNVQAFGGTWNQSTHEFVISPAMQGSPGLPLMFDRRDIQRAAFTDATTGWSATTAFGGTADSTPITLTATTIEGTVLTDLQGMLGTNDGTVRNGWVFAPTSGYTEGEPAYLSLNVGAGLSADDLKVWHFDGSTWTLYTPTDLTYDGTYANFTVTGFSGYAVSAVPEPTSLGFMALAGITVLARRRRQRRP
jgi:T5SS/PEP-CTERM-associated repeat protein